MIDYLTFIEELKELKKIHKDERPLLIDLDKNIFEEFKLSSRTMNVLANEFDINRKFAPIRALVETTESELLRIPNLGRKSLNEIKEKLAEMNLHLGMDLKKFDSYYRKKDNKKPLKLSSSGRLQIRKNLGPSSKSLNTISLTNSSKEIFGVQPNFSLAFVESPSRVSTSVGRK